MLKYQTEHSGRFQDNFFIFMKQTVGQVQWESQEIFL